MRNDLELIRFLRKHNAHESIYKGCKLLQIHSVKGLATSRNWHLVKLNTLVGHQLHKMRKEADEIWKDRLRKHG